jgi:DNA primase
LPVHKPKNNSTSFSYAKDGRFHCFSCGVKGKGSIDFVKELRQGGFQDAVDFLTVITPSSTPQRANSETTGHASKPLDLTKYRKHAVECEWLNKRVSKEMQERYGVFYYQNDSRKSAFNRRVLLPVKTPDGDLIGYLGRAIYPASGQDGQSGQENPKYLFPRGLEKSKFLFGAHELSEGRPHRIVYLVESPFAAMYFASLGFPCVAAYGWAVSDEQVQLLTTIAKGVVFLPDSNKRQPAGEILPRLSVRLWVRFPPLPDGIDDPEQMTREQMTREQMLAL